MSTRMWSASPSSPSATSTSVNAERPARRYRLPLRFTTPRRTPSRSTMHAPRPGLAAQEVGRAQDRACVVQIGVDLAAVVGVVAERDHVDAGREQLVGDLRRDPEAARGVLAVDDDERRGVALAQHRQAVEQRAPPDAADDVADEQDARTPALRPVARAARRTPRAQPYSGDGGRTVRGVSENAAAGAAAASRAQEREPTAAPTASARRSRRRRAWSSRAGCSWCCCRSPLLALWALAKAAGKVLVIFIVAGLIALILNPVVAFLQRGRLPRGLAVLLVYLAFFLVAGRHRRSARQPYLQPGRHLQPTTSRTSSRKPTRTLANLQTHAQPARPPRALHQAGQNRAADARGQSRQRRRARSSSFGGGLLTEVGQRDLRPRARSSCCRSTCCSTAQRIGALVRRAMPDGDGTPADDYPLAGAARGLALRRRPAAVQPDHGRHRRRSRCTSSACSASSPTGATTRSRSASSTA